MDVEYFSSDNAIVPDTKFSLVNVAVVNTR